MHKSLGVPGMWSVPFFLVLGVWSALAQSRDQAPAPQTTQPPFQLKVNSNLVVVRVVVRDAGKPVEGLRKEDFKILDQGKEQSILQFEAETSAALASPPNNSRTSARGSADDDDDASQVSGFVLRRSKHLRHRHDLRAGGC
jgi:hypothetical protein